MPGFYLHLHKIPDKEVCENQIIILSLSLLTNSAEYSFWIKLPSLANIIGVAENQTE
jgi:hypothetical protein